MDISRIRLQYRRILESGMFWELFPELTGNWKEDHEEFIKKVKETEESMRSVPESNKLNERIDGYSPVLKKKKSDNEMDAVTYIESKYPEMAREFKKIQGEQYETFCKKQRNYGPDNISVGTKLETEEDMKVSLTGIWFRVNDKIQRLKQLVVLGQRDEVGESVQDSFDDMSIYGIIAQIVSNGKWGK